MVLAGGVDVFATEPAVGIDTAGNAIAVWTQSDVDWGTYEVWASRYTVGGGWGQAVRIDTDDAGSAFGPMVAVDGAGDAIAVWTQSDGDGGTNSRVMATRYTVGGGWSSAIPLATGDVGGLDSMDLAGDLGGDVIAVWTAWDGDRHDLYANRFIPGTGWGAAVGIEGQDDSAVQPRIACDRAGNAVVIWRQWIGEARQEVWATRFDVETGWATSVSVAVDEQVTVSDSEIAVGDAGDAVAVWSAGTYERIDEMLVKPHFDIFASRFTAETGWSAAERIEAEAGSASAPQVAVDGAGEAIAVWAQHEDDVTRIRANRFSREAGWGASELVDAEGVNQFLHPETAIDGTGNVIAVWSGSENQIWTNRVMVGGGWGRAERTDALGMPIAYAASGDAVAVWSTNSSDGTSYRIWANLYR